MPRRPPAPPVKGTFPGVRHRNVSRGPLASALHRIAKASEVTDHTIGGFAMVPRSAILDRGLAAEDLRLLAVLCLHRDAKTQQCNPSIKKLALEVGRHRSNIHLRLRRLVERGHVLVERRFRKNNYIVLYRPDNRDDPLDVDHGQKHGTPPPICSDSCDSHVATAATIGSQPATNVESGEDKSLPIASCIDSRDSHVAMVATDVSRPSLQGTESRTESRTERPAHAIQPVIIMPLDGGRRHEAQQARAEALSSRKAGPA